MFTLIMEQIIVPDFHVKHLRIQQIFNGLSKCGVIGIFRVQKELWKKVQKDMIKDDKLNQFGYTCVNCQTK